MNPFSSQIGGWGRLPIELAVVTGTTDYPAASLGDRFRTTTHAYLGGAKGAGLQVNFGDIFECVYANDGGTHPEVGMYWTRIKNVTSNDDGERYIALASNTVDPATITTISDGFYNWNGVWYKFENYVPYPITDGVYKNIYIPASDMNVTTTAGAPFSINEYATNDINLPILAFDGASEEFTEFSLPMPENWDRSTIKAKFFWSSASGSTAADTVEWKIAAGALSDNDTIDAALGTAQVISDVLLATDGTKMQVSAATPAITVGGTPALGDLIHFKISRNVGGTDNMTEDAWLFGVWLQFKTTKAVAGW